MAMERLAMASKENIALRKSSRALHNEVWNKRVAKWSYDVIDHLEISRDIAYVSMNILDRYIAVNARETMAAFDYREAAIASLFISVKLSRSSALSMERLIEISQSDVSTEDASTRVNTILKTVAWTHPILPPSIFAKTFLGMFQNKLSAKQMVAIMEHVLYLVELTLCDPHFCGPYPSHIAFAALILAVHPTTGPSSCKLDQETFTFVLHTIRQKTGMDYHSTETKLLCSRLRLTYGQSYDGSCCQNTSTPTTVAIIEDADDDCA
jgi:hypothetical protein